MSNSQMEQQMKQHINSVQKKLTRDIKLLRIIVCFFKME